MITKVNTMDTNHTLTNNFFSEMYEKKLRRTDYEALKWGKRGGKVRGKGKEEVWRDENGWNEEVVWKCEMRGLTGMEICMSEDGFG